MEEKTIKFLKRVFFICILVMCITAVLSYCFVPDMSNSIDESAKYNIQIACSLVPMAVAIIIAIKVSSLEFNAGKERRLLLYRRWNIAAMVLFTLAFILNVLVKCAIDYVGAYYCAAICACMFVLLLYPGHSKLDGVLGKENKEK